MQLIFQGFDWDNGNRNKNLEKHAVSCEEAEEVFAGAPFAYPDERHSTEKEERFVLFGETKEKRLLFIAFTMRNNKVRVVSARPMSQKERNWYEQEKKNQPF